MHPYIKNTMKSIPRDADFASSSSKHFDGAADEWGFPQETRVVDVAFTSDPIALQRAAHLVVDASTFEVVKDRTGTARGAVRHDPPSELACAEVRKHFGEKVSFARGTSGAAIAHAVDMERATRQALAVRIAAIEIPMADMSDGVPEPLGTDDEPTRPHRRDTRSIGSGFRR